SSTRHVFFENQEDYRRLGGSSFRFLTTVSLGSSPGPRLVVGPSSRKPVVTKLLQRCDSPLTSSADYRREKARQRLKLSKCKRSNKPRENNIKASSTGNSAGSSSIPAYSKKRSPGRRLFSRS